MTDHLITAVDIELIRGVVTVADIGNVVVELTRDTGAGSYDARVDLPDGQVIELDHVRDDTVSIALSAAACSAISTVQDADAG